jgi:hypothetical protein
MVYEPKYLRFFQAKFEPLTAGETATSEAGGSEAAYSSSRG